MFAFRPPLLRADSWNHVCDVPKDASVVERKPEHALWRLIHLDERLPRAILGSRTTSLLHQDTYGVWHSHEPEKVAQYVLSRRLLVNASLRLGVVKG